MIVYFIANVVIDFFKVIFDSFGIEGGSVLPFGSDQYLQAGIGYLNYLMLVIPTLAIFYAGFVWAMWWKFTLLVLKLFKIFR